MNGDAKASFEPLFLDTGAGRIFAVYFRPPAAADSGSDLIYVPPLAEEMNRSRRIVAVQARALAQGGVGVLVLDLYGTGDSGGAFADARWTLWQANISAGADWIEHRGRRLLGLWGLRLGALLASQLAEAQAGRFSRFILWQPVISGRALLTQFLRIGVAASMGGEARESTEALRAKLAAGRSLEIAGYELTPELAAAVDAVHLENCKLSGGNRVDWIEIRDEEGAGPVSAGTQRVIDSWRQNGASAAITTVVAPPFWSIEEPPPVPNLIAATENIVASCAH